ncbi:DUF6599 family protein [Polyangium sp. y55x31]|uniref:DUF6599 family protein n=1 Tax=Polyangium sp. y55x31 TaxID=3042688 RepID=UPI002482CF36|nr:DUF6599 family protein [Polyangium sp. y55x31]MDI1477762.1 hypothetical protein [Polyangium sp. y55x31]
MIQRHAAFGSLLALALVSACKNEEPRGAAPPPPPAAKPAACAGGGGTLSDAQSAAFFPRTTANFCLDPNGGDKTYGEGGSLPLDQICDMFDGECEIYKGFGVRRVVELRYVDGGGSAATIDVHLSKFGSTEGAYAMFTKRVVGDGDPAGEDTPRPIEGGGAAALGLGTAYLWRGAHLAEITYNDEAAAEPAIKALGDKLLAPLVKEIGAKLPGETALPPAAAALPEANRIPLGVRVVTKDLLGIPSTGGGAFGYYKDGDKRYRFAVMVRADDEQAKDVLATLGKGPGAQKEKGIGDGAVRFMSKEGEAPAVEWIVARTGSRLVGIGDEVRVLRSGMTADEVTKVSLGKDEKIARLKDAIAKK